MLEISYISVCSGIEAASVAMSRIEGVNWHPVAFSEIDPFPCAVLAHHFPQVPNLGDLSKIHYNKETDELANGTTTIPLHGRRINAILGGTPCQDLSVAGLRKGAERGSGTRSALFYEYARLVEEVHPDWLLFENVPGMLSSNQGRDFYYMQSALVDCGYSLAWRILDAQYTVVDGFPRAVPQRRKRVWLVGCLGADESVPAQILFERPGLLGDTPPRREAGQGFACPAGYLSQEHDRVVGCACARVSGFGKYEIDNCAASLRRKSGDCGDGSETLAVAAPLCAADGKGKNGVATMLKVRCGADTYIKPDGSVGTAGKGPLASEESAFTLAATQDQSLVLRHIVRRLTPTECERLQAFPDGWTRIPYRGKPAEECPDSPRYKALGNSMATNCVEWVLRRIVAAVRLGLIPEEETPCQ